MSMPLPQLRRLTFTVIFAVFAWSIRTRSARADDFFVAPGGDDGNAGTAAAPWETLQHAADVVGAGDRVTVLPGTYTGFYLDSSGAPGNPIEFLAMPGALIDQPNETTDDGINLEGASYVVIDGFEVANMPRTGVRTVGFIKDFAEFVTIRNVYAHGNGRWGILTGHVDDLLIENNRMADSVIEHGIYVSNSGDRPIVRNNIVWGNNRSGIQLNSDLSEEGGDDGIISGALVSGNVIFDNGFNNGLRGGSALNFDGVQDSLVANNLLYDNHASGISLYMIDGFEGAKNNVILNNTIVQAGGGRWALNIQNASTGNEVRNNILVVDGSSAGAIDISANSLAGFSSDYNVVAPRFTTNGGTPISLSAWRTQTGQDMHSSVVDVADFDELFVAHANDNFHLVNGSLGHDSALASVASASDLFGRMRPYGAGDDIGALERILPGDYNADGTVNAADYTIWRNALGATVEIGDSADGNFDRDINMADFAVWKSHYGDSIAGFGASSQHFAVVPEPGISAPLIVLALLFAKRLRRLRRT